MFYLYFNRIIQRETGKNPGDSSRDRHLVQIHCCQMPKLKLDADNDFEFVQNIIEELNEPDHLNMECCMYFKLYECANVKL